MNVVVYHVNRERTAIVYASYQGGAYIDLTFGRPGTPTEVINVWNDTTQKGIPVSQKSITAAVQEWIEETERECPEWYEGYLENARHS